MKKIMKILAAAAALFLMSALTSCGGRKTAISDVGDFNSDWVVGLWEFETFVPGYNRMSAKVTITGSEDSSAVITDMDGTSETITLAEFKDLISDYMDKMPDENNIKAATSNGYKVSSDGVLYLNAEKNEVTSLLSVEYNGVKKEASLKLKKISDTF